MVNTIPSFFISPIFLVVSLVSQRSFRQHDQYKYFRKWKSQEARIARFFLR